MRIVLDTNVFISGVFFGGPPYQILDAWRHGQIDIVLSEEIFDEYQRIAREFLKEFKGVDISKFLDLLAVNAIWVVAPRIPFGISTDPDDDKFISCALASKTKLIVSGDKHLLVLSGYGGIEVLTPRSFIETFITS
ncbi:MAG: putative toxin-antitoxin system toxin component, PIN family [Nitrospirae bacterium]|nr:putative toxin-antitoxin system toxin component, PIN family [Nitrospirota bacterium]